jgi:hypothetical protein
VLLLLLLLKWGKGREAERERERGVTRSHDDDDDGDEKRKKKMELLVVLCFCWGVGRMGPMSTSAVQQLYDACKAAFCGGGGASDLPSSPIALERVRLALGMFIRLSLSMCVHVCLCARFLFPSWWVCVCVFSPNLFIRIFWVHGLWGGGLVSGICAKLNEWVSEWDRFKGE